MFEGSQGVEQGPTSDGVGFFRPSLRVQPQSFLELRECPCVGRTTGSERHLLFGTGGRAGAIGEYGHRDQEDRDAGEGCQNRGGPTIADLRPTRRVGAPERTESLQRSTGSLAGTLACMDDPFGWSGRRRCGVRNRVGDHTRRQSRRRYGRRAGDRHGCRADGYIPEGMGRIRRASPRRFFLQRWKTLTGGDGGWGGGNGRRRRRNTPGGGGATGTRHRRRSARWNPSGGRRRFGWSVRRCGGKRGDGNRGDSGRKTGPATFGPGGFIFEGFNRRLLTARAGGDIVEGIDVQFIEGGVHRPGKKIGRTQFRRHQIGIGQRDRRLRRTGRVIEGAGRW